MSRLFLVLTILMAIALVWLTGPAKAGPPVTAGATLRGVVHFEGKIPPAKPINMAADPVCAKQHSSAVMTQEVIADAKGDLQNVVVFVSDGLNGQVFDSPSQPAVVVCTSRTSWL
jgi:hypothetical protein